MIDANHLNTSQRLTIAEGCIHCGHCERECAFLQRYGDPGTIARTYSPDDPAQDHIPFSCSLCGLCNELCAKDLEISRMFLAMRRAIVARGRGHYPGHQGLLTYERLGASKTLRGSIIPPGCDTIYFPGCAMPGDRPGITRKLIEHLKTHIAKLGVVLNCCGKPSHDLGRQQPFEQHFLSLRDDLLRQGIRTVLVNCPNCYTVFKHYGGPLQVRTIYESLSELPLPEGAHVTGAVLMHDPCVMRREETPQKAVRQLLDQMGEWIDPIKHAGRLTRCCGEGGAVRGVNPRLAETWARRHAKEAHGERLVTYCAGCAKHLNEQTPTSHILDLLFEPSKALNGKLRVSYAPFSFVHRWLLKLDLRRVLKS